jgi:hypothetical protein
MSLKSSSNRKQSSAGIVSGALSWWLSATLCRTPFCDLIACAKDGKPKGWNHWFQIMASLGLYRAVGMLAAITGAALVVSWWVNSGDD